MAQRQIVTMTEDGGVAIVTLDNPPLNLLSEAAHDELAACAGQFAASESLRAVIFTGSGERAFSAGSDIREFAAEMRPGGGKARADREHRVFNAIASLAKPTLAAINGLAMGGGLEFALACDIRIADDAARLALPEIKLGVFPGGGGTERLPRLVGESKAMELMYLGEPISAQEALRIGLINRIAPRGQALRVARRMAGQIAGHSGKALGIMKRVIRTSRETAVEAAADHVGRAIEEAFLTDDFREGVTAFMEKRAPHFRHR